jgi:hypothetical protein
LVCSQIQGIQQVDGDSQSAQGYLVSSSETLRLFFGRDDPGFVIICKNVEAGVCIVQCKE